MPHSETAGTSLKALENWEWQHPGDLIKIGLLHNGPGNELIPCRGMQLTKMCNGYRRLRNSLKQKPDGAASCAYPCNQSLQAPFTNYCNQVFPNHCTQVYFSPSEISYSFTVIRFSVSLPCWKKKTWIAHIEITIQDQKQTVTHLNVKGISNHLT